MARFELRLPKMGESVAEATLTAWLKEVGDAIELDEPVVEIATDKVDSEVPSEVEGVLVERRYNVDDVVQVGEVIAVIEINAGDDATAEKKETASDENKEQPADDLQPEQEPITDSLKDIEESMDTAASTAAAPSISNAGERFYSPLVKNIAQQENIGQKELDAVEGSGQDGRVTKDDILAYVEKRKGQNQRKSVAISTEENQNIPAKSVAKPAPVSVNGGDEIMEMTRMGKLVSKYMVASLQTAAHVQSFIEVDVTKIWNWRNTIKDKFLKSEGEKITFTPIFMEAVAKAIRDFPMMNVQVDGDRVIKKKNINLGMAAALPDGNLIVPVIKNADRLNLVGMTRAVNDLAGRARIGKLNPDDTQGGTYTVTNVGTFGSVMGTPIINQPQVGILALGAIRKVPAVIETPQGDFIGIRHKMFLSHSYDHRIVNGALGGQFVQRVAQYLEDWDENREV